MKGWGRICTVLMFAIIALGLHGCKKEDNAVTIAYISKDLTHSWFQKVDQGIEIRCQEEGIQYIKYDVKYADDDCLRAVKDALSKNVSAILITTTNKELGPEISKMCKQKNTIVIAIDDVMQDENGEDLPLVRMPYKELGMLGGKALVKEALEDNFFDGKKDIKILQMTVPSVVGFRERMDAYADIILYQTELSEEDIININVENGMYVDVYEAVQNFAETYDLGENRWLICGANDDCAIAALHVLEENGVEENSVIACGIGGYELSVNEFEKNKGNYITILTQPEEEGKEAVEMVVEYLKNKNDESSNEISIKGSVVSIGGKIITNDNYRLYMK